MEFNYKIQGDKETIARLKKIGAGIVNLSSTMREVGDYLTGFFAGPVFASRGSVIGHPWPALSPSYATWKAEQYPGRPPLVREGTLVNSFSFSSGNSWAIVSNTDKKFAWHQLGK